MKVRPLLEGAGSDTKTENCGIVMSGYMSKQSIKTRTRRPTTLERLTPNHRSVQPGAEACEKVNEKSFSTVRKNCNSMMKLLQFCIKGGKHFT